jgi:lysylphosphatidylglycerol synthetase-like protein (DUF2156 family)
MIMTCAPTCLPCCAGAYRPGRRLTLTEWTPLSATSTFATAAVAGERRHACRVASPLHRVLALAQVGQALVELVGLVANRDGQRRRSQRAAAAAVVVVVVVVVAHQTQRCSQA